MKVRWIDPDASIGAQRGQVVVCIPVYGGHEHFVSCLESVLTHTSADVPILICDDASPDPRSQELVSSLEREDGSSHGLFYLRRERNVGFPANANGAFAIAAPADVLILNSDCVVAEGWLQGLRDAAYCDSRVATATALTNHGSLASVPGRCPIPQLPEEWSIDEAAAAVRSRSLRIRPRLPTAVGHCVYIRRSALELVGEFDVAFSPGYGEEVDFAQRCLRRGLCHVAADDVFVLHHGGGSLAPNGKPNPVQAAHEAVLAARYPYYHDTVQELACAPDAPLTRSLNVARRALKGLSLVVDARILTGPMTGTQLHILELTAAVARTGKAHIKVIVPPQLSDYASEVLETLPEGGLTTVSAGAHATLGFEADVVHRPYQLSSPADLAWLAQLGRHLVITHQDLISYHNPAYFRSFQDWSSYRDLTRRALAAADQVLFFSSHARQEALAEDLVEPHRASVVHIGVDHTLPRIREQAPVPPPSAARVPEEQEMMLCLGTDFWHKNRVFALRVLAELQHRAEWRGCLVLAGPPVTLGSSIPEEDRLLRSQPRLADAVVKVGAVSEAEKAWLLRRASLVLYPTVYEGFGLIPFEAAEHGVPCLWAPGTALSEILPDAAAGIVPWDAGASADGALELMRDEQARMRNVEAVRAAAAALKWDTTAERLIEIYNATCDEPSTPTAAAERLDGLARGSLSEDANRLVGPEGALSRDFERPLLALATHPQIGEPVFRAIKAGYRASYRLRRMRRRAGKPNSPS